MPVPPITNTAELSNKKKQTRGTGFTNINRVLDANRGAGQKMGEQIGGGLNQQADSVRAGIESSQNQFNQEKQQAGQQAKSAVQAGQNLVKQAGETDDAYQARIAQTNINNQPVNYSQIGQELRDAQYKGPMALQNAGQLQAQSATTSALGRLAGNTGGQQQLLQTMVAKPGQYTRGQSALDSLLLGQDGQKAIQQGRQATQGLQQKAFGAVDQAEAQAQALKSGISENKTKTLQALQNMLSGNGTQDSDQVVGIKELAKRQAESFNKDATRLKEILSGKNSDGSLITNLSPEDQQLLDNMNQYGLDNNQFYTGDQNSSSISLNNLANTLAINPGQLKFQGNQSAAAQNLATVLGDLDTAESIKNNEFNTDLFSKDKSFTNQQELARNADQEQSNFFKSEAGRANRLSELANSGNIDTELYETLESFAPGVRAYIDSNVPSQLRKQVYQDYARQIAAQKKAEFDQKAMQQDQKITSNSKDLRSAILQRILGQGN